MTDALKKANADFVKDLDQGLNTYIGSSVVLNFSGG